jgi:hypothetical protein
MNYQDLIETISAMVENETMFKDGLTLVYELDIKNHTQMNEELFYKSNSSGSKFTPNNEFEVELGGIIVRFVQKKLEV